MYLTVMGSFAYATNTEKSDFDTYGIVMPQKHELFPHINGSVLGFDNIYDNYFKEWKQHSVFDQDALGGRGREYDFSIYGITRFFYLAYDQNPNIIDSLFVANECILHITQVGNLIRDNRKLFLSKRIAGKLKAYASSQLKKARSKNREGNRAADVEKFGFDPKFLSHVVRLAHQAQGILEDHDLDLRKHKEHVKAIKRGEVSPDEVEKWFNEKENTIEKLYQESTLQLVPDKEKVKALLLTCLEHHYGSLKNCVEVVDKYHKAVMDIREVLGKYGV
jgi:predicted nucleotidyltransferase